MVSSAGVFCDSEQIRDPRHGSVPKRFLVSQHATDRELRRIVGEGRMLRRRGLDRDLELTDQYVTHGSVDQAVITRPSSRPPALCRTPR